MSQVHTLQMGRLVAAGTKDNLSEAMLKLADLEALHIVDYDDSEDGFSLGVPGGESEIVGRDLVKARAATTVVKSSPPSKPINAEKIRAELNGGLQSGIEEVLERGSRISDLDNAINSLLEQEASLEELEPLGVDLELLSGFSSITTFVGRVDDLNEEKNNFFDEDEFSL